jgi:hypothetical protein
MNRPRPQRLTPSEPEGQNGERDCGSQIHPSADGAASIDIRRATAGCQIHA